MCIRDRYALLACGLVGLVWRSFRGTAGSNRLGRVGLALAAVVAAAALSLLWTVDIEKGAYAMVAYYLPLGVLAALIGERRLTATYAARLAALQVAVACVLAAVALYEWQTRHLYFNEKLITTNAYTTFFRVNSLIFDPSLYGRSAMLALLTCAAVLVLAPPSRRALAAAVALPLIAAGLFVTYSQSSLVALVFGCLAIAAVAWPRRALIGSVVLVVALSAGALALPQTRRALSSNPLNKLSSSRLGLAERGGDAFLRHPLQGVGLGGYSVAASRTGNVHSKLAPHDVLVETASEEGLLGLAALAAFAWTVVAAIRAPRREHDRVVRTVIAIELGAIAIHSLAYDTFFEDPLTWAFAAFLAAGAAASVPAAATGPATALDAPDPPGVAIEAAGS